MQQDGLLLLPLSLRFELRFCKKKVLSKIFGDTVNIFFSEKSLPQHQQLFKVCKKYNSLASGAKAAALGQLANCDFNIWRQA